MRLQHLEAHEWNQDLNNWKLGFPLLLNHGWFEVREGQIPLSLCWGVKLMSSMLGSQEGDIPHSLTQDASSGSPPFLVGLAK